MQHRAQCPMMASRLFQHPKKNPQQGLPVKVRQLQRISILRKQRKYCGHTHFFQLQVKLYSSKASTQQIVGAEHTSSSVLPGISGAPCKSKAASRYFNHNNTKEILWAHTLYSASCQIVFQQSFNSTNSWGRAYLLLSILCIARHLWASNEQRVSSRDSL